jgi:hypothetical protein
MLLATRRKRSWLGIVPAVLALVACAPAHDSVPPLAAPRTSTVPKGAFVSDENDPKTWVRRLEDPVQRGPAVKHFRDLFDAALLNAEKNREDAKVKALLDAMVAPLTLLYADGAVQDDETRQDLLALLADTHDPRTAPALAKALGEDPKTRPDEVKLAAQATTTLAREGKALDVRLVDALWECFAKFRASQAKSFGLVGALHDSVLAVKHPSYGPKAVEMLSDAIDPQSPTSRLDRVQFWQATSIQVLGELKYGAAARPLVATLLTPAKSDLRPTVRSALQRMPNEAEGPLIAALKGTDPEFAKLASAFPDKAYVGVLAEILGYLSRNRGRDALVEALASADNDQNRTLLAMNLVRFPPERGSETAFLVAYKKVDPKSYLPLMGGRNARALLLRASANFYDPKLVDWLVKEKRAAKGDQVDEVTSDALDSLIKLMKPDQVKTVGLEVGKLAGLAVEKDKFKAASKVVEQCNVDASCYVRVLDQPVPPSPESAKMGAIKACGMAAMLGNETTRKDLLGKVDKIQEASVRLALVEAIDHLAPKGDLAAADVLEKIVQADAASANKAMLRPVDDQVMKIALSLRSRATQ